MKTLDEFNKDQRDKYKEPENTGNGIKCPDCGDELYDSDKMLLLSSPPQKNIHCEKCKYRGYRVA